MNFKRKDPPVDLDALDRALAHPGDRKPNPGPEAYAQPHIRNKPPEHPADHGWRREPSLREPRLANIPEPESATAEAMMNAALATTVSPQIMSRAGELLQEAHKALADQVRKACADEVEHAKELQAKGEQVALELEQTGKDLAIALSAQNGTVAAMFDEQKKFAARKSNLKEQIANGSHSKKPKYEKPAIKEVSEEEAKG